MKGVWAFWAHVLCLLLLLGLGVAWTKTFIFLLSPCFPFLWPWAFWLLILPYHFIAPTIALPLFFISCYLVGLRADAPAMPTHFFISFLLKASLAYFPHLYLFWAWLAYIPVILAHFTTSFLGLSPPIYLFSTFFTFMGFLLDSLGFLGLITTSLPPIIIWAYWLLSPIEFTNSFPKLPQPICFFFLLFSWAYCYIPWVSLAYLFIYLFIFTSFYSYGPVGH